MVKYRQWCNDCQEWSKGAFDTEAEARADLEATTRGKRGAHDLVVKEFIVNERKLTYGEKAVGLTFNPSNDPDVQAIKVAFAEAIDKVQAVRAKDATPSEKGAMLTLAIREAQSAQMWAVKAVTWEE